VFNIPARYLLPGGLAGTIGWLVFRVAGGINWAVFFAAVTVGVRV